MKRSRRNPPYGPRVRKRDGLPAGWERQPGLSPEQEQARVDGLRILARMIARRCLANPKQAAASNATLEGATERESEEDAA